MNATMRACCVPALVLALCIPSVAENDREAGTDAVASELSGIREALNDLILLVSRMERNADAELTLRQIELAEQRVSPLESQLNALNREYLNHQTWLGESKERYAQAVARVHQVEREGREAVSEELQRERAAAGEAVALHTARVEVLVGQRTELEDKIAKRREDIEILEERLVDLLEKP